MELKEGDRVTCTNSPLKGIVLKVLGNKHVLVLDDETGMELDYPVKTLIKIEADISLHKISAPKVKDLPSQPRKESITIDLHAEKLPASYRTTPPLSGQLDFFEYAMARAIRQGVRKIQIVHGRGTGKLKQEIVSRLRGYKQVKNFYDPEKIISLKDSKLVVEMK
ncbi:MAG TPA: Smr/MutS family protein [Bacteroidia bacterium]|nr:Smr/MutS family protein [Bacteroidia bacterium]